MMHYREQNSQSGTVLYATAESLPIIQLDPID